MNAVPTREELFEMAAEPIGRPELQSAHLCNSPEARAAAKRAQKLWLPAGKRSAQTTEAKAVEAEIRARNYDLEDAVEASGGHRGSCAAYRY